MYFQARRATTCRHPTGRMGYSIMTTDKGDGAVTKNDMVLKIARDMNMHQTDIKRIVQMTLDGITETLATKGRLELRNFGVFEVKTRKPRKARNPRTGEEVMVPARKSVTFKGGKFMEDRVNGLVGPVKYDDDEAEAK